jgi:tetratricopeptide (TPR) repeat protein
LLGFVLAVTTTSAHSFQTGETEAQEPLSVDQLKARDQLNQGVQAYKSARYDEALEHFQQAVMLDGKLNVARLYLATAYTSQYIPGVDTPDNIRMAEAAIEQYKVVLETDPQDRYSVKGIAYLQMQRKKFDEAREYYLKAIAADPDDAENYYSAGVVDWTMAYKDSADRKSQKGLKTDDDMQGNRNAALCREIKAANESWIDEGIRMMQAAIDRRAGYDDAMIYLNLLYRRKADIACGDQQGRAEFLRLADEWSDKAMGVRLKKQGEKPAR